MRGPHDHPSPEPLTHFAPAMAQLHEELGIPDPGWSTWL